MWHWKLGPMGWFTWIETPLGRPGKEVLVKGWEVGYNPGPIYPIYKYRYRL